MLDANTIAVLNQLGIDAASMESLLWSAILLTGLTIVTAIPTVIIAKRKGRSGTLWLLFALSIPIIPLLLIWVLPPVPAGRPPAQGNRE